MFKVVSIITILLLLNSCDAASERSDYEKLFGVEYGVISDQGKNLIISIKKIDKMNREEIAVFCYCLMKNTVSVERIRVDSHFYYLGRWGDIPPKRNRKLFYIAFDPLTYAKIAEVQDFRERGRKKVSTINFLEIPVNCE